MKHAKAFKLDDRMIFIFLTACVIILKWPAISLPYYWDGLSDVAQSAADLSKNNFFGSSLVLPHAPLGYLFLAIIFKIFGTSSSVANGLIVIMSAVSIFLVYKIGKEMHDEWLGLLAASASFVMPIFFSQSALANNINLVRPLFFLSLYLALKGDIRKFSISASLLALSRETDIIPIAIMTFYLLQKRLPHKNYLLMPFITLAMWLVFNRISYGWFVYPLYSSFLTLSLNQLPFLLKDRIYLFFIDQFRVFLTVIFIVCSMLTKDADERTEWDRLLFILLIGTAIVSYAFTDHFVPRYFVSYYPLLVILSLGVLQRFRPDIRVAFAFSAIMCILFVSSWQGSRSTPEGWRLEDNMEYIDSIHVHQGAARYLETHFADSKITTCWPMKYELTDPDAGYVSKPLEIIEYSRGKNASDIFYYSPQSNCFNISQLASGYTYKKRFDEKGKSAVIFSNLPLP